MWGQFGHACSWIRDQELETHEHSLPPILAPWLGRRPRPERGHAHEPRVRCLTVQEILDWIGDVWPLLVGIAGVLGVIGAFKGLLDGTFKTARRILARLRGKDYVKAMEGERPADVDELVWATQKLAEKTKGEWEREADRLGLLAGPGEGGTAAQLATSLIGIACKVDTTGIQIARDGTPIDTSGAWTADLAVDQLADAFHLSPVKELVVLGSPQAGKSAAAVLLTLGLLGKRTHDTDPVPVKFSLDHWDLDVSIEQWLKQRLLDDHPGFRGTTKDYGADIVSRLLDRHLIMPILDGLDELPTKEERERVVKAINKRSRLLPGLVLTCQAEKYDQLDYKVSGAVIVKLVGVSISEAQRFIKNKTAGEGDPERWQPVLEDLRRHKTGPLASALASPLMVYLLPKVYADVACSPSELLGPAFKEDPEAIEQHLLHAFVPAVFTEAAELGLGHRWRSDDARRWLGHIAVQLETQRKDAAAPATRFGWWDLSRYGRPVTGMLAGVLGALTGGAAVGLAFTALFGYTAGLVSGAVTGLLLGVACGFNDPPKPSDTQKRPTVRSSSRLRSGLAIASIVFVGGALARDVYLGMTAVIGFGLPIALLYGWTEPDPTLRPLDAGNLLQRDLRVGLTFGLTYGVPAVIIGWILSGNPVLSLLIGVSAGLAGALLYGPIWIFAALAPLPGRTGRLRAIGVVAFAHFGIATLRFAPRGKLPWRVMAFLDEAHKLGVLRMVSGSYEFRHIALQKVLAADYTGATPTQRATTTVLEAVPPVPAVDPE